MALEKEEMFHALCDSLFIFAAFWEILRRVKITQKKRGHFMKSLSSVALSLLVLTLSGCGDQEESQPATTVSSVVAPVNCTTEPCYVPGSPQDFICNVGDRIFYDFDKSNIKSESIPTLDKQADFLKKYGSTFSIIGHADERGSTEYNKALGLMRAHSHSKALKGRGVTQHFSVTSRGKEDIWPAIGDQKDQESVYAGNRASAVVLKSSTQPYSPAVPEAPTAAITANPSTSAACDSGMDLASAPAPVEMN